MNTLIKNILFFCLLCTFPLSTINSQNAEWHTYTTANSGLFNNNVWLISSTSNNKGLGIRPGITVFNDVTSVNSDAAEIPTEYKLFQNFPNPPRSPLCQRREEG